MIYRNVSCRTISYYLEIPLLLYFGGSCSYVPWSLTSNVEQPVVEEVGKHVIKPLLVSTLKLCLISVGLVDLEVLFYVVLCQPLCPFHPSVVHFKIQLCELNLMFHEISEARALPTALKQVGFWLPSCSFIFSNICFFWFIKWSFFCYLVFYPLLSLVILNPLCYRCYHSPTYYYYFVTISTITTAIVVVIKYC